MRSRYRFYTCPEPGCAKLAHKPDVECPTHKVTMMATIMQPVITKKPTAEETAKRLRDAGDKVGQAAGKPSVDPFGIANIFDDMAADIRAGRPLADHDDDGDDDSDDDDE